MIAGATETVSPALIGGVALAAAVLIPLMSAVLALFITRREHEAMARTIDLRLSALEKTAAEERQASAVSRARLHERVEKVERDIGERLDEKINQVRGEISAFRGEVTETLRTQPQEIVALLRTTQQLHEHR